MSDEQVSEAVASEQTVAESSTSATLAGESVDKEALECERGEKLIQAKDLYSIGSRNFLVKNYLEATDELSRVCALYAELYGDLADELGMPYLLYAKSLIALSLDENKVLDMPDEAADDDGDDDDDESDGEEEEDANTNNESDVVSSNSNGKTAVNGKRKLDTIKEDGGKADEADSTADEVVKSKEGASLTLKKEEEALVSSTNDKNSDATEKNGMSAASSSDSIPCVSCAEEKPSTSNGVSQDSEEDIKVTEAEENEAASNLQLAWEILETAAKIFSRQGANGLPNLAEVQTELGNIQFENCILDEARDDYEKALRIYYVLEIQKYRRAMAEIHYKIGLTYLMEQLNKEGASSLKEACRLIQSEIEEIRDKRELSEKDKNNIQDLEETKQEIEAKIIEIEQTQDQQIADVRAALDSYIKPIMANSAANDAAAGPSTSASTSASIDNNSSTSSTSASKSKLNDISHLIKRKKPEHGTSEAEAASPAKRVTLDKQI